MRRLVLCLALAACGPRPPPAQPLPPAEPPPAPAPAPLTADECGRMYDHLAELGLGTVAPQDRERMREDLDASRASVIQECTTGEVTRDKYDCFMAAKTWEAVQQCAPASP
jgi:hypothetical protein